MSDVELKEKMKALQKQEQIRDHAQTKKYYEQLISCPNPKATSYKGFYDYLADMQNKKQEKFIQNVIPSNTMLQISKEQFINKGIEEATRRNDQMYNQSLNRSI